VKFSPLPLDGAVVIEPELMEDERGFFMRTFCCEEFSAHGFDSNLIQCSSSFNKRKGTLRGMHYQDKPHEEAKIVRCTMGNIYDVIIDLRPESTTFKCWAAVELSADNRKSIYIPKGFAHGFLTLEDESEIFYMMSERFYPERARGVRWDDPAFAIDWPSDVCVISSRDKSYPDFIQ